MFRFRLFYFFGMPGGFRERYHLRKYFLQGFGHTAQVFQKYYFSKYFVQGFHHAPQIFQKYYFSKYFCRVFVTQLKYFKNIISANISAGDLSHSSNISKYYLSKYFCGNWSHSSPCFAFFAWSPFADPTVPPCW